MIHATEAAKEKLFHEYRLAGAITPDATSTGVGEYAAEAMSAAGAKAAADVVEPTTSSRFAVSEEHAPQNGALQATHTRRGVVLDNPGDIDL